MNTEKKCLLNRSVLSLTVEVEAEALSGYMTFWRR